VRATPRIHEGADLQQLATAVISQAVRDAAAKKSPMRKRLEAFFWLVSPEFTVWADFAGAEYLNPYKLLPHLEEARKKLSRR